MNKMKLFVSALEVSSNAHLSYLAKYLKDVEITGVCDEEIGVAIYKFTDFNTMGFIDVFKKITFFKKALNVLSKEASKCDKVLLIDSSSFNLRLAKMIKKINPTIEIIYYILPQVWAWKAWRAKDVLNLCDKIGCILPFERKFYKNASDEISAKAQFVGHPLLDIYKENINYSKLHSNIFTFMPGSRNNEILSLMDIFRDVKSGIAKIKKDAIFRIIVPVKFKNSDLKIYGNLDGFEIYFNTLEGLKDSSFAFICSGTATLEAALLKIPFILVYKAKMPDYFIARIFVKLNFIGLANILYNEYLKEQSCNLDCKNEMHKELIQKNCNAKNILKHYMTFEYDKYFKSADILRKYLKHGSAEMMSKWIKE